jgi:hypothetical protein
VARSLNTTLTEAARAAVQAREWERDREAWNLPHAKDEGPVDRGERIAGDDDAQQEETPPTDRDPN